MTNPIHKAGNSQASTQRGAVNCNSGKCSILSAVQLRREYAARPKFNFLNSVTRNEKLAGFW